MFRMMARIKVFICNGAGFKFHSTSAAFDIVSCIVAKIMNSHKTDQCLCIDCLDFS